MLPTRKTLVCFLDQLADARLALGIARRSNDPVDVRTTLTDVEHILSRLALDISNARNSMPGEDKYTLPRPRLSPPKKPFSL